MLDQVQAFAEKDIAWEAAVDQLATQVMVGGIHAEVIAGLRRLADRAAQAGLPQSASLACSVAASLEAPTTQDTEGLLKDAFTRLRQAKELESSDTQASPAATYASLGDDAELVADFLVEAREHLSQIENQMLVLEKDPGSIEVVHAVFRAFHTIKGLAGFLGFAVVQAVAHEVETLLDLARNEKLSVDSAIVDVVLESGDFLLQEMAAIDRVLAGGPPLVAADQRALVHRIQKLAVPRAAPEELAPRPPSPSSTPAIEVAAELDDMALLAPTTENTPPKAAPRQLNVAAKKEKRQPKSSKPPISTALAEPDLSPPADAASHAGPDLPTPGPLAPSEALTDAHPIEAASFSPANLAPAAPLASAPNTRKPEIAKAPDAGSVRVETAKLDHLMDMVGEMVIAQSLIRHSPALAGATDTRLVGDLSQLARVTAEVQRATMSMRMVPVGQLFQKIERVIRDLSRKAGKLVTLETSGMDTEVDKTVAEELSDPLLHMVRNSVDHGIEPAEERVAAGKEAAARIRLAAYHQGGQVVIEVSDDGRGLHPGKIRAKAEQKGLVASSAQLSETEIYQLIFEPGFSTAEKITDVSGRGVGMDVVRRNIEKLRGRIETQSSLGHGTTFLLKLPLTLAIIDGLVVEVGCYRYIIPLAVVREIFRPLETTLFTVEGRDEMVLVREQLLPIVRLNQRFHIEGRAHLPSDGLLVIIESENKLFCLLVDDLVGKQEVVIKGLGDIFAGVSGISGCAVLGDGQVGLILDTDGIYRGRRR